MAALRSAVRSPAAANSNWLLVSLYAVAIAVVLVQFYIGRRCAGASHLEPSLPGQLPPPPVRVRGDSPKNAQCCVMCTTPKDVCCLTCAEVSSSREHDLLMALMEGLTHHVMDKHSSSNHGWLKTRAWEGNSHIGNRPQQATYYYDWVRSLTSGNEKVDHVCEIGMNGGHSALVFLSALTKNPNRTDAKLTMFDFFMYDYSTTANKYIDSMYPRRFYPHKGDSQKIVPEWTKNHQDDKCDVFSVDGDHTFAGAKIDILNAAKATRKGGKVILDDMKKGGAPRRAFEYALKERVISDPRCVEGVSVNVGHDDRVDESNSRKMIIDWCSATVV